MPIYAYRCDTCGFAKDVLQKLSDAQLTTCPSCGAETFSKQVTAAGFQLKGSGWYVTDFRGGNSGAPAPATGNGSTAGDGAKSEGASGGTQADTASVGKTAGGGAKTTADAPAPAPAATPAKSDKGL
jgi:putative FmdB family regulatory protein